MSKENMDSEMQHLKESLLKMGRLLEEQIFMSVKSLVDKDVTLASEVIANDDLIDQMELDIEKKCYCLIALRQPLASDLRMITTALRIIIDIERMADHAEDISRITMDLHEQAYIKPLIDIPRMAVIARDMVEASLTALIQADVDLAFSLIPREKELDALYRQIFNELLVYMMSDPRNIPQATSFLLVAGHLERIGDHATNIAEMVLYVVEGRRIDLNRIARE